MKQYFKDKNGRDVAVDFFCTISDHKKHYPSTTVAVSSVFGTSFHTLKCFWREERTWDDHMGNTPCGWFCNVPLGDGTTKRVYYR